MTLVQCFKINLFRQQVNELNPPLHRTPLLLKHKPHVFHLKVCPALSLISSCRFISPHSQDASCYPPSAPAKWAHHQLTGFGLTASHCRGITPEPSTKATHCPSSNSTVRKWTRGCHRARVYGTGAFRTSGFSRQSRQA